MAALQQTVQQSTLFQAKTVMFIKIWRCHIYDRLQEINAEIAKNISNYIKKRKGSKNSKRFDWKMMLAGALQQKRSIVRRIC